MSEWQFMQKSAYLADFVDLTKKLQKTVVNALRDLEQDPVTPRGNTIKKLTGYENVWRYRLGDFRLIYAVAPDANLIQLLAVGPRGSIYERFNYDGWDAPGAAVEFGPELAGQPEWVKHPEWFAPEESRPEKEKLPRELTPALLGKWLIDPAYHPPLTHCLYEEDLLNMTEHGVPAEVVERVMESLYPAPVARIASQPDQVLLDPEDLLAYAVGTLTGFLLKLDAQQEPLTTWALSGPALVIGGPGSGKSTIALYRVRNLVQHSLEGTGAIPSVLFTTYTNALINSNESLLRQLLRDMLDLQPDQPLPWQIRVTTLHKTVRWIAKESGKEFNTAYEARCRQGLYAARARLQAREPGAAGKSSTLATLAGLRDDYLLEEFEWIIEGQNCHTEADYLAADPAGRGISFNQATRQAIWHLYAAYRDDLRSQNHYSWSQLVQLALDQVQSGAFSQRWDYVIVDEVQDLPPAAVALCLALCREPGGLCLAADANQSLYNRNFHWRSVQQELNLQERTRILKGNFRSTREIMVAARQILQNDPRYDTETLEQEFRHYGARPVIYAARGSKDQARWIARQVYGAARELRLPLNSAVVLVYASSVGQPLARALSEQGLPARFVKSSDFDLEDPFLKVTTLHAAKGLEFPIVAIAHVEAGRLPRETAASDEEEIAAFVQEQRRLFYVGCTRAMRYLFLTYDRQVPSPFLADLTDDYWMRL
jgi:superfamily I DNA/RNA helicase/mRNA-degrading endonuclease RelE of RelBE toxin-antitoxin system